MTHLRQRMLEELQRRNHSKSTIRSYLSAVEGFACHFNTPPDQLGAAHLRQYHLHLIERKLATKTIAARIAGLRFFYVKTLRRPYPQLDLPNPKRPKRLPTVLSREEVGRLLGAAPDLYRYTLLRTTYATALRRSEVCQLKVEDLDSERMMIRVRMGKGQRDRDLPMDAHLLATLRAYWRWQRPPTYLFPGGRYPLRRSAHHIQSGLACGAGGGHPGRSDQARLTPHAATQPGHSLVRSRRRPAHDSAPARPHPSGDHLHLYPSGPSPSHR